MVKKYEAGEFSEEVVLAATLEEYEGRIALLERKVGQLTMENDLLKKNVTELAIEERRQLLNRERAQGLSRSQ